MLEKADVIGWFDGDDLVSQVAVYPMKAKIFGKTYKMGGLTGSRYISRIFQYGADA